jgi:hypothetical protein
MIPGGCYTLSTALTVLAVFTRSATPTIAWVAAGPIHQRHMNALSGKRLCIPSSSCTQLMALTDRQMQFWEDVEDGLDDIEDFYNKQGANIDRIRQFGLRYAKKLAFVVSWVVRANRVADLCSLRSLLANGLTK